LFSFTYKQKVPFVVIRTAFLPAKTLDLLSISVKSSQNRKSLCADSHTLGQRWSRAPIAT
jgi:hypothetical protein